MRKILTQKFWSQGTSQGSPGSGSGADVRLGACQLQILVIWGPHEPLVLVALQGQAKKLKTIPAWCECEWSAKSEACVLCSVHCGSCSTLPFAHTHKSVRKKGGAACTFSV